MKILHKLIILFLFIGINKLNSNNDLDKKAQQVPPITKAQQPQKAIPVDTSSWPILVPIPPNMPMRAAAQIKEELIEKIWNTIQTNLDQYFNVKRIDDFPEQINIEKEYKKLTEKDLNHIKKVVNDTLQTVQMSPKNKKMLSSIITKALIFEYNIDIPLQLGIKIPQDELINWCNCFSAPKRITFIYNLIQETISKHPKPNYNLVITSFAAGRLLQEYVLLSELYKYYHNITVNIIDLEYPKIPLLARSIAQKKKRIKAGKKTTSTFLEFLAEQEEQANMIDNFKTKIAQEISLQKQNNKISHKLNLNIYTNAYEYIAAAQKNNQLKSDVMLMIDPGAWLPAQEKYPSFANTFLFWTPDSPVPAFILFAPRGAEMELYQLGSYSTNDMEKLKPILIELIQKNTHKNRYNPRLFNAFLHRQIIFSIKLQTLFPTLWKILTKMDNLSETEYYNKISEPKQMEQFLKEMGVYDRLQKEVERLKLENSLDITETIKDFLQIIPQTRIALMFNKTIPVLFVYANDAYVAFRDLVMLATKNNPIIYIEEEAEEVKEQIHSCPSGTCKISTEITEEGKEKMYPSTIKMVNKQIINKKLDTKKRLDTIVYDYVYNKVPLTQQIKKTSKVGEMKKLMEQKLQNIPTKK